MINILHGDCMDLMASKPDNYYDLAIVDPPYGINIADWDHIPSKKYFIELNRVSKNTIIWGANYYNLPPSESWLCWHKTKGFKNEAFKGASDFELALTTFGHKSKYIGLTHSGNISGFNVKRVDYNYKPIHPTQKPVALYKWLLKNYAKEGDKILDTHGGSMSSAIACHDYGFDLDIIELDKDYYNAGKLRFDNHIKQLTLFK